MPFESKIIAKNMNNTDATLDFTSSGFGTPDAAIIFISRVMYDDGRVEDHHQQSISLWDGTRVRCVSIWDEDGQATTDAVTSASNSAVIMNSDFGGVSQHAVSNITDGIRLTEASNNIVDLSVTVVLLKGVSNVRVDDFTPNATAGGTVSVTDPAFDPDWIMFLNPCGMNFSSGVSGKRNDATFAVAHVVKDGAGFDAVSNTWASEDGVSTSNLVGAIYDNGVITENVLGAQELEFTSFDANGFTVESVTSDAGARAVAYLAVKFDTGDVAKISKNAIPSSAQTSFYPTSGVNPNTLILQQSRIGSAVYNSLRSGGIIETNGHFLADDTITQISTGGGSEHNVVTSVTIDYSENGGFVMYQPSGAGAIAEGVLQSLDTEGFTILWTTPSTLPAFTFVGVAIGPEAVAVVTGEKPLYRGIDRGINRGVVS
jgi:hypothetical protein